MRNRLGLALKNALTSTTVTPELADRFLSELANVPEYDDSPDGPNARRDVGGGIHVEVPVRVHEAWQRVYSLFPELLPKHGNPIHERPNTPDAETPGLAWQDPDDPEYVITDDIPPKLGLAWRLPTDASRRVFLICELAYYLRGPAMFDVATKAHEAQVQERSRAEQEGATAIQAWSLSSDRWSEVLRREADDPANMWMVSDADAFAQVLLRAIDVAPRMRNCPNPTCPAPHFIAGRKSQLYCSDACALPAQRESKRIWWSRHGQNYRGQGKKLTIGYHQK
jgi:hypothetical protein